MRRLCKATAAIGTAFLLPLCSCSTPRDGLDVWIMSGTHPDPSGFFDAVASEFEEKTGVSLNVEYVPWADAKGKFVTAMAGGTLPDVAEVGTTWTPEFAEVGVLLDLTDRMADPRRYLPELVVAGTYGGRIHGVPWHAGIRSVVYRTDLFDELGLDEPTTWSELREAALTVDAAHDIAAFPVAGDSEHAFSPFIWGAGGDIATENPDGSWEVLIDSPESREGIGFYADLALADGLSTSGAATWRETDLTDNFAAGNAAMAVLGNWTVSAVLSDYPDLEGRVGVFPIPGADGGYSPSFVGGSHLSVFNTTENENLAWELVELLTTGAHAVRWAEESGYFPGTRDGLAEFTRSGDPLVAPFATQLSEGGGAYPATPDYAKVQEQAVLQRLLQAILSGQATVEEATSTAAEEVDEILNGDS